MMTLCLGVSGAGAAIGGDDAALQRAVSDKAGNLRVPFVENLGQVPDPQVRFYARTFGGTVFVLQSGAVVYALPGRGEEVRATEGRATEGRATEGRATEGRASEVRGQRSESGIENPQSAIRNPQLNGLAVLTETFGTGPGPAPVAGRRVDTRVHCFLGSDPARWRSDLPAYDTVSLGEIGDGISLDLKAHGNSVEKIFTVAPGADPLQLRVSLAGADSLAVGSNGELEVGTQLGVVRFSAPVAWQTDTAGRDLPVSIAYAVNGRSFGFALGAYDPALPLMIDPVLSSTLIGGRGNDHILALAQESGTSNIVVAGHTASVNFPTTNALYSTLSGGQDAFVAKFDFYLTNLLVSTYLGGTSNDAATSVAIDGSGNILVAGYTESSNFPAALNAYSGNQDGFVAKLNSELSSLTSAYIGDSGADAVQALAVSAGGMVYAAGYTESSDLPMVGSGYTNVYRGGGDGFVARFNTSLVLTNSTFIGGDSTDAVNAVALSGDNDVFVSGYTYSTDFPMVGAYQPTSIGGGDAFVAKFNAALATLSASTYLGGTDQDSAQALVLDPETNVYVAGFSYSINFDPGMPAGSAQSTNHGGADGFIVSLNNALDSRKGGTFMGGSGNDAIQGLAVGQTISTNLTNLVIVGYTASANFPVTLNASDTTFNGSTDAFVAVMTAPLTDMYAATYLGGASNDQGLAIAIAPGSNSVIVVGATASGNFPVSDTAYNTRNSGGTNNTHDGFITRLAASLTYGTKKWETFRGGAFYSSPCMGPDGTIYVGGSRTNNGLLAFHPDGTMRWYFSMTIGDSSPQASPAIGTNGLVYMGSEGDYIYAVNADSGAGVYSNNIGDVTTCPAFDDVGNLYLGTAKTPELFLYRISRDLATTNVLEWGYQIVSSSAALGTNSDLYIGTEAAKKFLCFNITNGFTNGIVSDGDAQFTASPAINTNGAVYCGSAVSNKLYEINATGGIVRAWTLDGGVGSPAIGTNGFIYVGTSNGLVYEINLTDSTTQHVWSVDGAVMSTPAIGMDGSIYVGAENYLYSLNSIDGTTNWAYLLGVSPSRASSPLVGMDGTIYIGSGARGSFYAVYGPTPPDLDAPWHKFHHDMMNHGRLGFDHRPNPPASFTANYNAYPDHIQLNWSAVPHATAYEIYRFLDNLPSAALKIASTTRTNYDDTIDVVKHQDYYYWVKAKTPLGNSTFSVMGKGKLGDQPLKPEWIDASRGAAPYTNSIRVRWGRAENADGYIVYRGTNDLADDRVAIYTNAITAATNGYTNLPPVLGLRYYYWVAGTNRHGIGPLSAAAYGGTPPLTPTGLSADKATTNTYVRVTWNGCTGATDYVLYTNISDNVGAAGVATRTGETSFDHYDVIPIRLYYYWVQSSNEFGAREYSTGDSGWRVLAAPYNVSASTNFYTNIVVSWSIGDVSNTTSHQIYRSLTDSTNTAVLHYTALGTASCITDQVGVISGKRYYYWIKARNVLGQSSDYSSPSAAGSTPPLPPTAITATDGSYLDKVRLVWNSASLATWYKIYRSINNNTRDAVLIGTVPSSLIYYDDTSASPGITYYYWVRSVNDYGESRFGLYDTGWRAQAPPEPPVLPDPPAVVTASDGTFTGYVAVAWSGVANATAYEVWRNTEPNSTTATKLVASVAATGYQDASATAGIVYYYWVKSKTSALTSLFSPYDSGYRSDRLVDIGVSDFVILPTVLAAGSHPDAVSFRIANYGPLAMTAPDRASVMCDFYLSTNAVFGDADDIKFGAFSNSVPMVVRTSQSVVLSAAGRTALTIPDLPLGRSYYIFVHVRHCLPSTWYDPVPDNNTAMRLGQTISIGETKSATTVLNDYNGDGRSDLAVYYEPDGNWYIRTLEGAHLLYGDSWGAPGYQPVVGDFDDSGMSDLAVYNEETGYWFIRSVSGAVLAWYQWWGAPGYQAVPGDYDGDGRSDLAVYCESTGLWYVETQAGNLIAWAEWWGAPGYLAVPGDYDGDGKSDFAVYHPADGYWYIRSLAGATIAWAKWWGGAGYRAVPGDYDGDGISDLAVYHDYGYWFIQTVAGKQLVWGAYWGAPGYLPVPGDYDGDGIYDLAVYDEKSGLWYIRTLAGVSLLYSESWGAPGYLPVSSLP